MPEEVEVETKDLQEAITEIHERHEESEKEESKEKQQAHWIRYIALTTAIFAVFAAIGAMQSGAFVNEAMMLQIKASDTWSQYQSDKQKAFLSATQADALLDRGVAPAAGVPSAASDATAEESPAKKTDAWKPLAPAVRLEQFIQSAERETAKTETLRAEAEKYEKESEALIERHHRFAWSVALIQVAIALAAIGALTRIRSVWLLSMAIGLIGVFYFAQGMIPR